MTLRSTVRQLTDATKIVTPAWRQWSKLHADDPYPDWVVELIRKELVKGQRDRTGSFSGSSAGSCLRAQEFGFLGVLPPIETLPSADLLAIFDDGRWRHLRWQANLLSAGILDRIEVPLDWPNMRSKGSMDGTGTVPLTHRNLSWRDKEFGFELKGMNGFLFAKAIKKPLPDLKHCDQVARYFLVSGLELFVVLYECKLTQRTHEWVLTPDDVDMEGTERELKRLNKAIDQEHLHDQLRTCGARMGPYWASCAYAGKGGICETWRDKGKTWV